GARRPPIRCRVGGHCKRRQVDVALPGVGSYPPGMSTSGTATTLVVTPRSARWPRGRPRGETCPPAVHLAARTPDGRRQPRLGARAGLVQSVTPWPAVNDLPISRVER